MGTIYGIDSFLRYSFIKNRPKQVSFTQIQRRNQTKTDFPLTEVKDVFLCSFIIDRDLVSMSKTIGEEKVKDPGLSTDNGGFGGRGYSGLRGCV